MRSNEQQARKDTGICREAYVVGGHPCTDFVKEVLKSIEEGKAREISDNKMSLWHGPVHYVTVFGMVQLGSISTRTLGLCRTLRSLQSTFPPLPEPVYVAGAQRTGRFA